MGDVMGEVGRVNLYLGLVWILFIIVEREKLLEVGLSMYFCEVIFWVILGKVFKF